MDDLISRQAAIDALGERPMVWTDDDQYALGERNQYDRDRLAIETLPCAQRCENCEHSSEAPLPNRDRWCNTLEIYCTSDWFCADWERREE